MYPSKVADKDKRPKELISIDYTGTVVQAILTKPNEPEEKQTLVAGPKFMAICKWRDGRSYTSDVPNLVLQSRAAHKPVLKRPCAATGKGESKPAVKKRPSKGVVESDGSSGEASETSDLESDEEEAEVKPPPVPKAAAAKPKDADDPPKQEPAR